jgi:tetratricopeptide (TPR) repeat protein
MLSKSTLENHRALKASFWAIALVSTTITCVANGQTSPAGPNSSAERAMRAGAEAMRENKPAQAEESFKEATRLAPQFPSAFLDLGLAQLREGKLEGAENSIRTACRLAPALTGAHMFLGVVEYQMHHYEEARQALKNEIALNDRNAEAQMWLGIVELADGHPDGATAPLDRAADLKPNDLNILDYRAQAHTLVARDSYAEMYKLAPDSWQVHRALGESYAEQGKTAEAIAEYQTALTMQPQNSDLYEALGDAYQKRSKFPEAKRAYEQELQWSPHNMVALYNLGKIAVENEQDPKAGVPLLHEVVKVYQHSAPADFYLGLGLVKLGNDQEAIPYLEKVAQDESIGEMPKRAAYELARAYRRVGRPADSSRALAEFQKLKDADEQQEAHQNEVRNRLQILDKSRALSNAGGPNAP